MSHHTVAADAEKDGEAMSDLEDLAEIADSNAFGFHGITPHGALKPGRRPPTEFCGAGHPWTEETTRRYKTGKRIRRVCRICDRLRGTKLRRSKGIAVRNTKRNATASEAK